MSVSNLIDASFIGFWFGLACSAAVVLVVYVKRAMMGKTPDKWEEHRRITEALLERKVEATEKIARQLVKIAQSQGHLPEE